MVETRSTSQMPRNEAARTEQPLRDQERPIHQQPRNQIVDQSGEKRAMEGLDDTASSPMANLNQNDNQNRQTNRDVQEFRQVNPDFNLLHSTLQAVLQRVEQMEKRSELQRTEDFQRFQEIMEERFKQVLNAGRDDSRDDTHRSRVRHTASTRTDPGDLREEDERGRDRQPEDTTDHSIGGHSKLVNQDKFNPADQKTPPREVNLTKEAPGDYRRRFAKGTNNSSPFTDEIANAPFPKDLNLNFLSKYDGKHDPLEHVEKFEMDMCVRDIDEPLMTRLFATTLMGAAQKWFQTLPPKSIKNFGGLASKFILNFATSKRQPRSALALGAIRQQAGETLQKYLDRFKETQLQVHDLKEDVHLHLLIAGLNGETRLARSLYKDPVITLEEFRMRAKKYLELEQMEIVNKERKRSPPKGRDHGESNRGSRGRNLDSRSKGSKRVDRYEQYTPLNVSRSQLWKEVALTEMKKVERPISRYRAGLDKSRFCDFHNGPGHTTDECFDLRDAIEKHIREGKLRQYIIRTQGHQNKRRSRSPGHDQAVGQRTKRTERDQSGFIKADFECNVISGAYGGGGDTGRQRKKYLREVLSVRDKPKFTQGDCSKSPQITFSQDDLRGIVPGHEDGLVITANLGNCRVKKIFIDAGSSADIIMWDAFKRMKLESKNLQPCQTALIGFNGEHTMPKGCIDLRLTLGTEEAFKSETVKFIVADFPSPYNIILGRPTIHSWDILFSTKHQMLKFANGHQQIITIRGDQKESRQCYFDTVQRNPISGSITPRQGPSKSERGIARRQDVSVVELDMRDNIAVERPEPEGKLEEVIIGSDPTQTTKIGVDMNPLVRTELITFLTHNRDVFAWTSADLPGVDPQFCCHQLAIIPGSIPVAQKKRKLSLDRRAALNDHVEELLRAGFIREIQYTTWLSNVVMVKKPSGKWRVCTDYTDLNKVCPKDSYPMPNIDQLVDNSAGYQMLSFMDAYSGYNQIPMHPDDQDKTAFITEKANYCYTVMPFGLKNAGATYQRMMNKVFSDQIGHNIEVYIDDMIVKSLEPTSHIQALEPTFAKLREYQLRLNPAKCAFGVPAGKFLGFLLTSRGIEANPDKCQAVLDMAPPQTKRDVQRLTGRLAALQRFLPKSAENALPFFKLLKKEAHLGWNKECDAAFQRIKQCLATPPVLTKPEPGESLYLYLAVGEEAISAVLIRENEGGQMPIYFVSRALQGAELRYQKLEKVAFALLTTARRLRPYFQGHSVIVRTNQPIRQVLHKPDLAGRMTSWAMEMSEFDIRYEARQAIKSQALADFVMELTPGQTNNPDVWKIYVDGSSNLKGSGAGIIVESPEGVSIEHSLHLNFPTSNNQAEYEAVLAGLIQAREQGAIKVQVSTDSQLVAAQINGTYQAKGPLLIKYLEKVREAMAEFEEVKVVHIPRTENVRADILSKLASTKNPANHRSMIQQSLSKPSCVMAVTTNHDWRAPIISYLEKGELPDDPVSAKRLAREAAQYALVEAQLYRKGIHAPMLACLGSEESEYVLSEIHEGINGQHMGARALIRKALRAGYYWPTMKADAETHVQRCEACQKHAKIIWSPSIELHAITAPWPFFKWGMDILGPFKPATGQLRWLIVAIDYFTKWIEAEPLATITASRIMKFFERCIISRFGIPAEVITDNGTQFTDKGFQEMMAGYHIKQHFASVEHPQSNGQAEAANKVILSGLRKRMADANSDWVEQLYPVLWGYRTTVQTATRETPFRLTYGCEAMIPVEIGQPSWRLIKTLQQNEESNQRAIIQELELIDEIRHTAQNREIAAKQLQAARYNQRVKPRSFQQGELILRRADIGNKNAREGKLAANWEGPYRVRKALSRGAYQLETLAGKVLKRTWNVDKLRKYYS